MTITERHPVRSANLVSIAHDPDSERVWVEFRNRSVYSYPCDAEEFAEFLAAESKGSHFALHFRNREFVVEVASAPVLNRKGKK